jgi:hypothetical protein
MFKNNFILNIFEKAHIKKWKVLFITLSLFVLFFPVYSSYAQGGIIGALTAIPTLIVIIPLSIFALVSGFGATLAGELLLYITSGKAVPYSYTNPDTNELLKIGLDITRPFANVIIVIFLVVIALSIALRVEGYGTKKTFFKLILVALLVNFTTVFMGLIVDASNIIVNYFLQAMGAGWNGVVEKAVETVKSLLPSNRSWTSYFNIGNQIELIGKVLSLTVGNVILMLILGLWSLVFILRYVAIWFLVILSPLAFVFSILPATNGLWKQWYDNFIAWVLVGVNASFFLYIADRFALAVNSMPLEETNIIGATIKSILPIIFYCVSFIFTLSALPKQVESVGNAFKKAGYKIRDLGIKGIRRSFSAAGDLAKSGAKWADRKLASKSSKYAEFSQKVSDKLSSFDEREIAGKALRGKFGLLNIPGVRKLVPESWNKYVEGGKTEVENYEKELGIYGSKELVRQIDSGQISGFKKLAALKTLAERGDIKDLIDQYQKSGKDIEKEMFPMLNLAHKTGNLNKILKADPRLAQYVYDKGISGFTKSDLQKDGFDASQEGAIAKAAAMATPSDISKWSKTVLDNETIVRELMKKGRSVFENAIPQISGGLETFLKTLSKIIEEDTNRLLGMKVVGNPAKVWEFLSAHSEYQKNYGAFVEYIKDKRSVQNGFSETIVESRAVINPKTGELEVKNIEINVPKFSTKQSGQSGSSNGNNGGSNGKNGGSKGFGPTGGGRGGPDFGGRGGGPKGFGPTGGGRGGPDFGGRGGGPKGFGPTGGGMIGNIINN